MPVIGNELDFAGGYFTVYSHDWKNPDADPNEPFIFISDDCPPEIKERLLAEWERVKAETIERQRNGKYLDSDYFIYRGLFNSPAH